MKSIRIVMLLMVATLSGCTSLSEYLHNGFKVGPNYRKPVTSVAPKWIDADDIRVRSSADDLSQWWKVFNDPVLDDLICHAYRQNLTLRQAGFRVLQARAQFGITRGELFPQTQTLNASATRNATSVASILGGTFGGLTGASGGATPALRQYFNQYSTGFASAWELDFWGRFRRAIEASSADLDASVENYDDVLVTLLGDVANNYVEFRVLQQQIELINENARLQRETLKIVQARFEVGKTTELDPSQSKSILAQTLAQIPQTEIRLRRSSNRLCILLGIPPEELQTRLAKTSIPDAPTDSGVGIPADLLRRRPDIRRAERQAAAESARIGVAQSELYPHISITGTVGFQGTKVSQLFTSPALQGSIGPTLQWEFLNYGRVLNRIRLQKAKFQEVVAIYQQKVLTAAEEVENGMALYLKAQEQVKHLTDSVANATKARTIGASEFKAGKVDFIRVSVLEQNLVQQQNLLAQARGDVALGLVQVYRALGGGWQIRTTGCESPGSFPPASILAEEANRAASDRPPVEESPASSVVRTRFGPPLAVSVREVTR